MSLGQTAAWPSVAARAAMAVAMIAAACAAMACAASAAAKEQEKCRVLAISFVGAIGTAHIPPTVAWSLKNRVNEMALPGVCFKMVSTYCPWCAHRWIRKQFGLHGKERATPEQIAAGPRIVMSGYSSGAPSALYLARKLEREGIPIELLMTEDSKGFTRGLYPPNVKVAANFYERGWWPPIFGKSNMRVEDETRTEFMGNIRLWRVGHFGIVRSRPVADLFVAAIRKAYDAQTAQKDGTVINADKK